MKKKKSLLNKAIKFSLKTAWKGTKYAYIKSKQAYIKNKEKKEEKIKQAKRPKTTAKHERFKLIKNESGSLTKFENKLKNNSSLIGLILGARGKGKSALGLRILENLKKTKKLYAIGFKEEDLPTWINSVNTIEEIPNKTFVLIDEGGITFSSRKSGSKANKVLSELLLIARHKDISVLFISQNSANIEINTIRQADYLLLKPSSLLQKDFERKKIKEIYEKTNFKKYEEEGILYIYSDEFTGYVTNTLPSFWNTKISKAWQ